MRAVLAVLLLVAVVAQARIRLSCPPPLPGTDDENQMAVPGSPCGSAANLTDTTLTFTTLGAGARETIMFLETVSVEDSPFSIRLCNRSGACPYVILDHIPHLNFGTQLLRSAPATRFENRPFSLAIQMPNIQCDECFLQLIQVGREAYNSGEDCTFAAAQSGSCAGRGNTQYVACAAIRLNGTNPWNPIVTGTNGLDYSNRPDPNGPTPWQFSNENNRPAGTYRQYAGNNAGWDWPVNERNTIIYGYRPNNVAQAYRNPTGYCNRMFTANEVNYKSTFYNPADFTPAGGKAGSASSLNSIIAASLSVVAALFALLM